MDQEKYKQLEIKIRSLKINTDLIPFYSIRDEQTKQILLQCVQKINQNANILNEILCLLKDYQTNSKL